MPSHLAEPVIRVEGLRKKFRLGQRASPYGSLRESIVDAVGRPLRRLRGEALPEAQDFWALDGIDLEVRRGEALGIIGRNGAGKSTLLKVLSRITEPTDGRVTIRGRVASLLEVGTGFHSELTGRENIFLNGAILGMSRKEIARKFDAIVAFSEVGDFLDTPVKRYSSGMYMRLAFAVAACLEPEILIVDEVLAVGDLVFQKKCLDSMKGISDGNHTILFVSHNMAAIHALCSRCLLLDSGRGVMTGPTTEVVQAYIQRYSPTASYVAKAPRQDRPTITSAAVTLDVSGAGRSRSEARVELTLEAPLATHIAVGIIIRDHLAIPVAFASLGQFSAEDVVALAPGANRVVMAFPVDQLALGSYTLSVRTTNPGVSIIEHVEDCLSLVVERPPAPGATATLLQSWGFGAVELPAHRVASNNTHPVSAPPTGEAANRASRLHRA